jgi:hypothetical protein
MFSVINSISAAVPAPATLVATPLPENFAQRVPSTNVPPPVSSVQINNNARGNGGAAIVIENIPAISVAAASNPNNAVASSGQATQSSGVNATFLAQLIGQQVPPAMQGALSGVLAAYDQLVMASYVKYRPSNAQLPPPAPSGVYERILQQQPAQTVATPQPVVAEAPQPVQPQQPAPAVQQVQAASVQQVNTAPQVAVQQVAQQQAPKQATPSTPISAYRASAARVETTAESTVKDTA